MATSRQRTATRQNTKKAQSAARRRRTLSRMPAKTRSAMGKEGAKAAGRKRRSR